MFASLRLSCDRIPIGVMLMALRDMGLLSPLATLSPPGWYGHLHQKMVRSHVVYCMTLLFQLLHGFRHHLFAQDYEAHDYVWVSSLRFL